MNYCADAGVMPAMAERDALSLWRRARGHCGGGGAEDRRALAELFRPMVEAEALRLRAGLGDGAPDGGFVGWGNLGLLRALCCYRPDSAVGFYEHCLRRVRETMREESLAPASSARPGIAGAVEVARLWGELSREFAAPRVPDRRRLSYSAAPVS